MYSDYHLSVAILQNNSIQYLTAFCDGFFLGIVNIKVPALMERSGWKMATMTMKGEFGSATATSGARFVTSHGHPLKHLLSASSLVSSQMVSDFTLYDIYRAIDTMSLSSPYHILHI